MDDYPDNSRRVTAKSEVPKSARPEEPKKVVQVTTGEVIQRKKRLGKRFSETFVDGDARGVWGYVMLDVIIPAVKDTVADAVSEAVERMLFGDRRSSSRRRASSYSQYGHVNYRSYGSSTSIRPDPRNEPRSISRRARATHDFGEIILATRVEAEEVIDKMFDLISKFDQVTVADLYDLVGVTGTHVDNKWGWTNIQGAKAERVRGGYLLDLPRPDPLD